jgi:hypothetical protein
LQEAIRLSLKPEPKPEPAAPAPPPPSSDLLDFSQPVANVPAAAQAAPPIQSVNSDFFSAGETVQSDPYAGQGTAGHNQSFASLPVMHGSAPPSSNVYTTNFAAAAPGALVVSTTQSTGYNAYGLPQPTPAMSNPHSALALPPTSTANPYGAPAAAANPYGAPTPPNPYNVPNPGTNPYGAQYGATNPYGVSAPATTTFGTTAQGQNPNGAPNPIAADSSAPTNHYAVSASAPTPFGAPASSQSTFGAPNPIKVESAPPANPYSALTPTAYGAPTPGQNPYGTQNPMPTSSGPLNPYGAPDTRAAWTPPDRITTQPNPYDSTLPNPYNTFNGAVPSAVSPHPPPTPSSLGFGSPAPDFSGFSPGYANPDDKHDTMANGMGHDDPAPQDFGQSGTKGQPSSFFDQTFAKLASLDNFSIESKKDASRANPFEFSGNSTIGGNKSLADIAKNKVRL